MPLYWIVDADEHQVEIWTPDVRFPRLERDRFDWTPARGGAATTFSLSLAELFRPI